MSENKLCNLDLLGFLEQLEILEQEIYVWNYKHKERGIICELRERITRIWS